MHIGKGIKMIALDNWKYKYNKLALELTTSKELSEKSRLLLLMFLDHPGRKLTTPECCAYLDINYRQLQDLVIELKGKGMLIGSCSTKKIAGYRLCHSVDEYKKMSGQSHRKAITMLYNIELPIKVLENSNQLSLL